MASTKKITISDSVGKAIEQNIGKSLTYHTLAAIKARQDIAAEHGWEQCLDNEGDRVGDKLWMSHDVYEGKSNTSFTSPVTVSPDVKKAIAHLLYSAATLIVTGGKLPAVDPLAHLTALPNSDIFALMVAVVGNAKHLLCVDPLCRDYDYPKIFKGLLESLVPKKMVDPGSDTIAKLFVDFIKVIAWHAAQRAYEAEHLTLNWATLLGIIASMASIPSAYDAAYSVINSLRVEQPSLVKQPIKRASKKLAAEEGGDEAPPKKAAPKKPAEKKPVKTAASASASASATAKAGAGAAAAKAGAAKKTVTIIEAPLDEEEDEDEDYETGLDEEDFD